MEAQAWTAIGVLAATLLGALFYLGQRIDGLGGRIDGLGGRLDARIDGLDARMDGLGGRLDARIDGLDARIDVLGGRLDARIDGLGGRLAGLEDRLDARLDGLEGHLEERLGGFASDLRENSSRIEALNEQVAEQGARLADGIYEVAVKLDDHLRRHAS